jgi:hypothetical protein
LERRISKKLELDDNQRTKLAAIAQQLYSAKDGLAHSCDNGRVDLLNLLTAEQLDRDKAKALLHQQITKLDGYGQGLVDNLGDLFDSLGAHQRQRLRLYVEKRGGCCHC